MRAVIAALFFVAGCNVEPAIADQCTTLAAADPTCPIVLGIVCDDDGDACHVCHGENLGADATFRRAGEERVITCEIADDGCPGWAGFRRGF